VNSNRDQLQKSSSGGIFFKTAEYVINSLGGVVFGAAYCDNFSVKIVKAETAEEINRLSGSKYVYSDTDNSYREAEKFLKLGRTVLYSGVSCQIAGLLSYLKKDYDKLICVEVLCHGAPSQELFKKYIQVIQNRTKKRLLSINQRDKSKPWNQLITKCVRLSFDKSKDIVRTEDFDPYMSLYVRELSYRDTCYKCKYIGAKRIGDIVLGDFGGLGIAKKCRLDTSHGVSFVMVNSDKGDRLMKNISCIEFEKRTLDEAKLFNSCLRDNVKMPQGYKTFIKDFEQLSAEKLFEKYYYKNCSYLLRAFAKKIAFSILGSKLIAKLMLRNKK
ncbi:MAG: Coenzyme F420 hydrogenase/dehydrogenase, beta subunit C-terminal domain, partial [Acutalibacteraceae bacterium]